MFELKYKKCRKCIYRYKTEIFDCCCKPDKYGLKMLRPQKYICFGYVKKQNKTKKSSGIE